MQSRIYNIIPYYSPIKCDTRQIFLRKPSPRHWEHEAIVYGKSNLLFSEYVTCFTIFGWDLNICGYVVPRTYRNTLFIRCKLELPNDPEDLIGLYKFNNKKVIQLSRSKVIEPPLIVGGKDFYFEDKFIGVAAALYRGDLSIDVFAPRHAKKTTNHANTLNFHNFS